MDIEKQNDGGTDLREPKRQTDLHDDVLQLLWNHRKHISIFACIGALLAGIISFIIPSAYSSTATILPESEKSKIPGSISDLASFAGLNIGSDGSLTKLYPAIVKSDAVLRPVIYHKYSSEKRGDSLDLITLWELDGTKPEISFEKAFIGLSNDLEVSMDTKLQILTLKLTESEPKLTADILNQVVFELDRFIRTKRNTTASQQRKFVEARLAEVKSDLTKSEDMLQAFRERNRQILGSPQLILEQERLLRDVNINAALSMELRKQFELAKIEEIKNVPIISVMDRAIPATKRASPKRSIFVFIGLILGALAASSQILYKRYGREVLWSFSRRVQ